MAFNGPITGPVLEGGLGPEGLCTRHGPQEICCLIRQFLESGHWTHMVHDALVRYGTVRDARPRLVCQNCVPAPPPHP